MRGRLTEKRARFATVSRVFDIPINDPMRKSIAILVVFLSACANKVPELGRDLPRSWSDQTPYFDERIKHRFPIGSDKAALVDELRREGFSVRKTTETERWFRHVAVYDQQGPCRETWSVAWDDDQTKLTNIEGRTTKFACRSGGDTGSHCNIPENVPDWD